MWHSVNDTLQYVIKHQAPIKVITKRTVLASIAQIYDPLGLLGPVIVTAKILIQRLWQLKISWDETVPIDIHTRWRAYETQLSTLNGLKIPRKVIDIAPPHSIEMHGFCDASINAYGACVYIRTSFKGRHTTQLLCAKSRASQKHNVAKIRIMRGSTPCSINASHNQQFL